MEHAEPNHRSPAGDNHPLLALTAHMTAQAWIIGGFNHADWFDTREGRQLFAQWSAVRTMTAFMPSPFLRHQIDALILRHRTLDRRLEALRPEIVIELGAGLSPRGVAYAERHRAVRYLEFDLDAIVNLKRKLIAGHHPPANFRLVAGDLTSPSFDDAIRDEPLRDARVVVISEGVMPYLPPQAQRTAWRRLADLLEPVRFGAYLLDMYSLERLAIDPVGSTWLLTALSLFTHTAIGSNLFASDQQVCEALQTCGFPEVKTLEPPPLPTGFDGPLPWLLLEAHTAGGEPPRVDPD